MPDISMCADGMCPLASGCFRFLAIPSSFRQSWFGGGRNGTAECAYYWPVTEGKRVRSFDKALAAIAEASEDENAG